ncbi:UvrD-helicase domain-containing protein, partial [Candidatus Roizmanbacteria bacterium]|nr:UvrD-helicase domain-containing protein [Candidatus Roizmanbacteria bacterium]
MSIVTNEKALVWDDKQESVISAEPFQRIVVEAGPGMGKTAVACARVAHLINEGVEPSNIWLVSFTRTAIKEIRDRIKRMVSMGFSSAAVRISTVDSHVWRLRYGFDDAKTQELFGSYEANIINIIEKLKSDHQGIMEYLGPMQHFIVDEAQDLVGDRCQLVYELICRLPKSCGITVFCDSAQAIYGFADDDHYKTEPLKKCLLANHNLHFEEVSLIRIHRTNSPLLQSIFLEARNSVLDTSTFGTEKYDCVRDKIIKSVESSDINKVVLLETDLIGRDDILVLYRRRVDVLQASSLLRSNKIPHRLRMSGLPPFMPGWIAEIFSSFTDRTIKYDDFRERWANSVTGHDSSLLNPEVAWGSLVSLAGDRTGRVECPVLREILARSQPPAELAMSELGSGGPILSTIHASKGREAYETFLMLPPFSGKDEDNNDEEARVLFVGATRGTHTLRLGEGYHFPEKKLGDMGRVYRFLKDKKAFKAQVEIGRENDVDVISPVSTLLYSHPDQAIFEQRRMLGEYATTQPAFAISNKNIGYRYKVGLNDFERDAPVALLNQEVNSELFGI